MAQSAGSSTPVQGTSAARRPYAIIEAPSILGLKPSGVEQLPKQLLGFGLLERTQARHAGRVQAQPYDSFRDPETLTLNAQAIAEFSRHLADSIGNVVDRGEFPLVLGGDCSILLGSALALRRRGRFGLLFIDGHSDFYQPEVNPNGEAASMELAFATGYGPKLLTDLEGRAPLVRSSDVVAFGFRDAEEQAEYHCQPLPEDLLALDLAAVRRHGAAGASQLAIDRLSDRSLDGFFIHVDADCLSDDVMPAVDYRIPDGLSWDELSITLATALASGKAVGLEIAIYNPKLDEHGSAGRALTELLARVLGTGAPVGGSSARRSDG